MLCYESILRQVVDLECDFGSIGWKTLVRALNNNPVWQHLKLDSMNVGDEGVKALAKALQQNTQWTKLKLANVRFASASGGKAQSLESSLECQQDMRRTNEYPTRVNSDTTTSTNSINHHKNDWVQFCRSRE